MYFSFIQSRMENWLMQLPQDVICCIVCNWLDQTQVKGFVALDLALLNRLTRQRFLECFKHCKMSFTDCDLHNSTSMVTILIKSYEWLSLRGAVLTGLQFQSYLPKSGLNLLRHSPITKLQIQLQGHTLHIGDIFENLTQLQFIEITGYGIMEFSTEGRSANLPLVLANFDMEKIQMKKIDLEKLIIFLGTGARALREFYMVAFPSNDCEALYLILRYFTSITTLNYADYGCENTPLETFIDAFHKHFPEMQYKDKPLTFPTIQRLIYNSNMYALMLVYHNFTHLQEVQLVGISLSLKDFGDTFLTHPNHPIVSQFSCLALLCMDILMSPTIDWSHCAKLLLWEPHSDELLRYIVTHFTSLTTLNLQIVFYNLNLTILVNNNTICWQYLTKLHFRFAAQHITEETYRVLLSNPTCFPVLTLLSLDMTEVKQNTVNLPAILHIVLTSPLHAQIEVLRLEMSLDDFPSYVTQSQSVNSSSMMMIPIWPALRSIHLVGWNVSSLPFEKFPNLYHLDVGDLAFYENTTVDTATHSIQDNVRIHSILSSTALQQIGRLKEFVCMAPAPRSNIYRRPFVMSMQIWYDLLAACPSLDTVTIRKAKNASDISYWDWNNNPEHRALLQSYRYRIRFLEPSYVPWCL